MQELEKILEEIDKATDEYGIVDYINNEPVISKNQAKDIIRRRMNGGWIPVEERLPEYGKKVLAYGKSGEIDIASLYSRDKHMWLVGSMCSVAFDIIAWHPLLEPYRPERSE